MQKKPLIIAVIAIVVLSVGAGVWEWEKTKKAKIAKNNTTQEQQIKTEEPQKQEKEISKTDTSDWITYKDEKYGFEIKYPEEWEIKNTNAPAIGGEWSDIIIDRNRQDIGMNIARFKINENSEEWIKNKGLGTVNKKYQIDDHTAYYIKIDNPKVYLLHQYLVSNKNSLVYFDFQEKYRTFNNKTNQYDETSFSQYLPAFEAMVNSIKFAN